MRSRTRDHNHPTWLLYEEPTDGRPAAPETEEAITGLARTLPAAFRRLRPTSLDTETRYAQGGKLFAGAPILVDLVATALELRPDLYPDVALAPADLRRRQRRADAWLELRVLLEQLLQLASDSYLAEQAGLIDDSAKLVDQVIMQARLARRHDIGPPHTELRLCYLRPAIGLLREHRRLPAQRRRRQKSTALTPAQQRHRDRRDSEELMQMLLELKSSFSRRSGKTRGP